MYDDSYREDPCLISIDEVPCNSIMMIKENYGEITKFSINLLLLSSTKKKTAQIFRWDFEVLWFVESSHFFYYYYFMSLCYCYCKVMLVWHFMTKLLEIFFLSFLLLLLLLKLKPSEKIYIFIFLFSITHIFLEDGKQQSIFLTLPKYV